MYYLLCSASLQIIINLIVILLIPFKESVPTTVEYGLVADGSDRELRKSKKISIPLNLAARLIGPTEEPGDSTR